MPGVIGGNSGTFILAATTLLLHGWIDNDKARIAIVPGAPTSAMTEALADRLHASGKPDMKVELRAESFRIPLAPVEPAPAGDADLRIGQDLLAAHPIEIDFPHHGVRPLSASEARHAEHGFSPIVLTHAPDGTLSVAVSANGSAPIAATLDLSSVAGVAAPGFSADSVVTLGAVAMRELKVADAPRPVVGLYAFRHMRVIFDLAHDRIWVRG